MTDWDRAKCIGKTELFFSERINSKLQAKLICADCPIKRGCLLWALERQEAYGIWGGADYYELRIVAISQGYEPPDRKSPQHGTEAGWAWHRKQRIKNSDHEFCRPCISAYNEATRLRMAQYRKRKKEKNNLTNS